MIAFVNNIKTEVFTYSYPLSTIRHNSFTRACARAYYIFFISYATSATTCYISLCNSGLDGGRRGGRSDRRKVYLLKKRIFLEIIRLFSASKPENRP